MSLAQVFSMTIAVSPNFGYILVSRFISGFCNISVPNVFGVASDMWAIEEQGWPVNICTLSVELGIYVGPLIAGAVVTVKNWTWIFWVTGATGLGSTVLYVFAVPETRAITLLDRRVKQMNRANQSQHSVSTHKRTHKSLKERVYATIVRPTTMLLSEPIVSASPFTPASSTVCAD